ncbi:hypothetical protein EVAR_46226_1 [Eumeta japonica]|uniref:Uncharacterized protein n=1 Tax=Eumeta variegata TaxID=151549 RepID=A0A4C1XN80_EUMVA|nr:hypothetical protein EVAR_46226_1 [Eumeta japonica]
MPLFNYDHFKLALGSADAPPPGGTNQMLRQFVSQKHLGKHTCRGNTESPFVALVVDFELCGKLHYLVKAKRCYIIILRKLSLVPIVRRPGSSRAAELERRQ